MHQVFRVLRNVIACNYTVDIVLGGRPGEFINAAGATTLAAMIRVSVSFVVVYFILAAAVFPCMAKSTNIIH